MRGLPVRSDTDFDEERNGELGDVVHQAWQMFTQDREFVFGDFQHQFVVHLKQQAGLDVFSIQPTLYSQHGTFDEIGGRALHGGVDGGAFCTLASVGL